MPAHVQKIAQKIAISTLLLTALLLSGSTSHGRAEAAGTPPAFLTSRIQQANRFYSLGEFANARLVFREIAADAAKVGASRAAAMNWNNAGGCSLNLMQYGRALADFTHAERVAKSSGQDLALASTLNNIASLYLHTGQPENALQAATEGLRIGVRPPSPGVSARLEFQLAIALIQLNRFDEAHSAYRRSIDRLMDQHDLDTASRELGLIGTELVKNGRLDEGEQELTEGLRIARVHRLPAAGNILRGLGNLRSRQGDLASASKLFDAALSEPPSLTPRWSIYTDRGTFRLKTGQLQGAMEDFREARRIATQVRADIVPADQDRIRVESGLSELMEGLVDTGNLLAAKTKDGRLLRETFDAAEQDRLWSLRALIPGPDDWRTRLPERYWELLAKYQALQRTAITGDAAETEKASAPVRLEMQRMEAAAANGARNIPGDPESALVHIQNTIRDDTVLFSFHITKTSSWLWAVDRQHTEVFPLDPAAALAKQAELFSNAIRSARGTGESGRVLFGKLFGQVPERSLRHKHWLLEPDGPLYDLPFSALVTGTDSHGAPVYLIERASLQAIPSALLLERGSIESRGGFLGIGDPIYNLADSRFRGRRGGAELTLPRLPNTAQELEACARTWNAARTRLLTGSDAAIEPVEAAIRENPAVIHFATHVVASQEEFRSGLIALSLNRDGAMELLSSKEIVARPVHGGLVVLDGCHSSQGKALPGTGLMGLTRAWIGAGARAVVATQWDVPDEASRAVLQTFYRRLSQQPDAGLAAALQEAQISELRRGNGRKAPGLWAGYFLLSRI